MAVPKKRHSKSKVQRRRLHWHLKAPGLVKCENCGKDKLPHRVCPYCGFYKGREIVSVKKEKEKE
ncbi:50S ribosomal protein L32 [Candidatus Parcubacteria bacterium]|nr:50S ribosomal protein L32 [Candidatus Parcubacteria bacterium]